MPIKPLFTNAQRNWIIRDLASKETEKPYDPSAALIDSTAAWKMRALQGDEEAAETLRKLSGLGKVEKPYDPSTALTDTVADLRLRAFKGEIGAQGRLDELGKIIKGEQQYDPSTAIIDSVGKMKLDILEEKPGAVERYGKYQLETKAPTVPRTPLQKRKDYQSALNSYASTVAKFDKVKLAETVTVDLISDASDIEDEMGITDKLLTRLLEGIGAGQKFTEEAKKQLLGTYIKSLEQYKITIDKYEMEQEETEKRSKYDIDESGKKVIRWAK